MAEIEFITAEVCPFAQRTHLALKEKGLDYDHAEVDLKNKPAWFEEVSPYSKVPVLKHDGAVVYESAIINEYIEERFPEPPLMPADPRARAAARVWIDYCNTRFIGAFYGALSAKGEAAQGEAAAKLTGMMVYMEEAGLGPLGSDPYWLGAAVSLVDLAFWPFFERLPAVTHYRGVGIPDSCPRLAAWNAAMEQRESVRKTRHDAAYYIKSYARYDAPAAAAE
jgi:glutathione S-transferase